MAQISINKPHNRSLEEVRSAAERLAQRLDEEYGVDHVWQGDNTVTFNCAPKGIKGTLTVGEGDVQLNIKLGLLASMFERTLRNEINTYLDKHLG